MEGGSQWTGKHMSAEEHSKYFETLELAPGASFSEVRNVYERLRSLYSGNSLELSAINGDFTEQRREDILRQIEEAFERLSEFFEDRKKPFIYTERPALVFSGELKKYMEEVPSFSGPALRQIREMLDIELEDIVGYTNIRKQFFAAIEDERFSSFPAEIYLRGYITEYARFLSLDTARVVEDCLARYRLWKKTNEPMKQG